MRWVALALLLVAGGCERRDAAGSQPAVSSPAASPASSPAATPVEAPTPVTRYPAAGRVVALGDVHGDLAATRAALRLGGLIDGADRWTGGDAVLVQTGDVLDRGDGERAILDLLLALKEQAPRDGGKVVLLNGNHELMNAAGDLRYVTPGGFRDFEGLPDLALDDPLLASIPADRRARVAAFRPGGVYARKLASHPVVAVVGKTVYAHGGVLPKYARDIERMNREVAAWLWGIDPSGMRVVGTSDSPVWSRHYSDDTDEADCKLLSEALELLEAERMVVGHTVQPSISSACEGRVWRVDVGMSAHYGGKPEVLEITSAGPRALRP